MHHVDKTISLLFSSSIICWSILHFLIYCHFQANCIDSTAQPTAVFAGEVKKMVGEKMKPQEQLTLEPYERDHAVVVGVYRYEELSNTYER